MRYRLVIYISSFLFLAIISNDLQAQFAERIGSGRPGNANGAFSVGKGVYQVQTGFNYAETSLDLADGESLSLADKRTIHSMDAMFRIGIKEDFELRISGNFNSSDQADFSDHSSIQRSGLESINIGIRQTLFQQKGILPATAIQFTANFSGSKDYRTDKPDATFRINFTNSIAKKLIFNYNFSSRWQTDNSSIQGFYIFSFGYPLTENFSVTAETFGLIGENNNVINGGLGLAYMINDNFQLDVYGSYGRNRFNEFSSEQELTTITTGISYRIVNR